MGYSKSSKQHGVNRKPIWRGMLALVVIVGGVCTVISVVNSSSEKHAERLKREVEEDFSRAALETERNAKEFDALVQEREIDEARFVVGNALMALEGYFVMSEVDAEFELDAIQHKLKVELEQVKIGRKQVDSLLKVLDDARYDILRSRKKANQVYSSLPSKDLRTAEETLMKSEFKMYKDEFGKIFERCFKEKLSL